VGQTKIKDIALRIFAVIIALLLWVFASTEDNPVETWEISNIPVTLINVDSLSQSRLVLVGDRNNYRVNLNVRGRRRDLQLLRTEDIKLEANLAGANLGKGINPVLVEVKDKPANIEIPDNQPLFINVTLEELVEKDFGVSVQVTPPEDKSYAAQQYTVKPQVVTLSGAASYIGSVKSVVAKVDASKATSDLQVSMPVQILDSKGTPISNRNIECNPQKVDISVPIKKAKDVSVNVQTVGKLPHGVTLKGNITASPSKVSITGSDDIISSIQSIDTVPINLGDITESTKKQVKLIIPDGVTLLNNPQGVVTVDVNVETTTTKTFSVQVTHLNLPDGLKAEVLTNTINVTLSGQEGNLNNIAAGNITAVVDLAGAPTEDGEYEFSPSITYPPSAELVGVSPQKIKIRITKKQG
jgi:YbbR domain-containing protein